GLSGKSEAARRKNDSAIRRVGVLDRDFRKGNSYLWKFTQRHGVFSWASCSSCMSVGDAKACRCRGSSRQACTVAPRLFRARHGRAAPAVARIDPIGFRPADILLEFDRQRTNGAFRLVTGA